MQIPSSLPSLQHAPPPINSIKCMNPSCFCIPSLNLLPPNTLSLTCTCSQPSQSLSLKTYLSTLNSRKMEHCQFDITHSSIPALQFCTNCELWLCNNCISFHETKLGLSKHKITDNAISSQNCRVHPSNEVESYCIDCKVHYCQLCMEHKEHKVRHLKDMLSENEYQKIKKDYDNAKWKFYKEIQRVKDEVVKDYEERIKEIKEAYEKCLKVNEEIVAFIDLVCQNYEENKKNYFLILNVLNNTHFNKDNIEFKYKTNVFSKQKHNNILKYFADTFIITNNISNNSIKSDITIKSSINILQTINNCNEAIALLPHNKIATGTPQCSIKIFTLSKYTNTCNLTIPKAHDDTITYLSYFNNKLFSCSYDKNIKIWKISNIQYSNLEHGLIFSINAHSKWINKLIPLTNNRFATCSNDCSIKIWNNDFPFNLISKLEKHIDNVNSIIQLRDKEMLVSVSSKNDSTFRMWDLKTYSEMFVIYKVQGAYYNSVIELKNGNVVVGGLGMVYVVDVMKKDVIRWIVHKELEGLCVDSLIENGNYLICGCERGKIMYIDIGGYCNVELKGVLHKDDVSGLICMKWEERNESANVNKENSVIVSASYDGNIKVWEG